MVISYCLCIVTNTNTKHSIIKVSDNLMSFVFLFLAICFIRHLCINIYKDMSEIPFIKLLYGPYEANGFIRHKTQRLHSVIQCLTKLGYEIEIVASIHINRLSVEMFGREIYRCDIRNLPFNLECEQDIVCKRLVEVVEEAAKRMYSDANLPQYCPLTRGKRVIQEIKYAKTTQDLFSPNVKLWFEIPKNSVAAFFDNMEKPEDSTKTTDIDI